MTRDSAPTPEKVENRRPQTEASGHDSLQPYRLDGVISKPLSGNFTLPKDGRFEIPNIWQTGSAGDKTIIANDKSPADFKPGSEPARLAAPGENRSAGSEHVVKAQDSLWKIAKDSLNHGDAASATEIAHKVQAIIRANKAEHPSLGHNAHMIHPGMKLHIPGGNAEADRGSGAEPRTHSRHRQAEMPRENGSGHGEHSHGKHPHGEHPHGEHSHGEHLRPLKTDNSPDVKPSRDSAHDRGAPEGDGGRLAHALKKFGQDIADTAIRIAHSLGTVGDCAKGPRLTMNHYGFHLPPAVATQQGRMMQESGMFHEVPRSEVRPGDYGVRDWNRNVTRQHGMNKGDSFIVTNVGAGGSLKGANDHIFQVPEDGGRYRNLKFMRPTPEFYRKYGQNNV